MYALGGRGRCTSHVYPTDFGSEWGMALFASPAGAAAAADVWALDSIWGPGPSAHPEIACQ